MNPRNVIYALCLLIVAMGCQQKPPPPSSDLSGSGSTFIYPLMNRWEHEYYKAEGVKISYRGLGSTAGIKHLFDGSEDFGCTDGPLTPEQLTKAKEGGNEIVHIPVALGAVVPVYNLPDFDQTIHFNGPVLADIYRGEIKRWDDPRLVDLNRGIELPKRDIVVVHRTDGSGTTYIWTDYFSKVSEHWHPAQEMKWFAGSRGAEGNGGVAQEVKQTPGAIGYVELVYAFRKDLPIGLVQNHAGKYVRASLDSISRTANYGLKSIPEDLRFSLTDLKEADAYPITGATWVIVRRKQSAAKGPDLIAFLRWVLNDGQEFSEQLFYARLPADLADRAEKQLAIIEVPR
jgi:phosphate ABC transporter phosphate-binding protein